MKPGRATIWKWESGSAPREQRDDLASEDPLEIRVGGRGISVTMRTPGHDEELAAGFLLTEGIIKGPADVRSARPVMRKEGCNAINVALTAGVSIDFDRLTRHVFASSSCGLCGKATIDAVMQRFPPVGSRLRVKAATLMEWSEKAAALQSNFRRSGGLHAAGLFSLEDNLIVVREDIGRHNAVDKVVGYAVFKRLLPLERHVLTVSGRASFEIVQKALAARIPMIAAVSAPSSLAVEFAAASGQTLVGFLRAGRMNVYSHPERVIFPD